MNRKFALIMSSLLLCVSNIAFAQLDPVEEEGLLWMREEEKLARDVYITLYDLWGLNIFNNISNSEQRHMDTMLEMIELYGLEDPVVSDEVGVFGSSLLAGYYDDLVERGKLSLLEALHVGAFIEELDIADLRETIAVTEPATLVSAYDNLLAGSYNHLRGFVGQIVSLDGAYVAQVLSQQEVEEIVGELGLVSEEDFEINAGLNDTWFYPETSGQGFVITVYPDQQRIFLAWFTYDTALPEATATSEAGAPGQRWLTAQGAYSGAEAELQVYSTSGGLFDRGDPAPVSEPVGSLLLQFNDCNSGTIVYELQPAGLSGLIPIERIAHDNIQHCEQMAASGGGSGSSGD